MNVVWDRLEERDLRFLREGPAVRGRFLAAASGSKLAAAAAAAAAEADPGRRRRSYPRPPRRPCSPTSPAGLAVLAAVFCSASRRKNPDSRRVRGKFDLVKAEVSRATLDAERERERERLARECRTVFRSFA